MNRNVGASDEPAISAMRLSTMAGASTPYPTISLQSAHQYLKEIARLGPGVLRRNDLLLCIGYSVRSSAGAGAAASLAKFGLLSWTRADGYVLTETGARLQREEEPEPDLLRQIALTPKGYSDLYRRFGADVDGAAIATFARETGVAERKARTIVRRYDLTMDYAGLLFAEDQGDRGADGKLIGRSWETVGNVTQGDRVMVDFGGGLVLSMSRATVSKAYIEEVEQVMQLLR